MDHKSEDSHHGGTSVVEFDGTLGELGVLIKLVPSEINVAVSEVTDEFSSGDVLHDGEFEDGDEDQDLGKSSLRHGVRSLNGGPSLRDVSEESSLLVDGSRKVDSATGGDLAQEGQHSNTSVLKLNISETVELFLVTAGDKSKRIVESKRRLGSKSIFESAQGGGGGTLLGRSKGGSGGDKGGEDSGLHLERL